MFNSKKLLVRMKPLHIKKSALLCQTSLVPTYGHFRDIGIE